MKSIINFRSLASGVVNKDGLKIKDNMILRSAQISSVKSLEISDIVIYDLRSESEIKNEPTSLKDSDIRYYDLLASGAQNVGTDFDLDSLNTLMFEIYGTTIFEGDTLRLLVKDIVSNTRPFLFHCTAGKDRTGMLGAIIMLLLDFEISDIYNEYLIIDSKITSHIEQMLIKAGITMTPEIKAITSVSSIFLDTFFQAIEDKYMGVDAFIKDYLKLELDQIEAFKANYLCESKDS